MPDLILSTKDSAVCDAHAAASGVPGNALMDRAGRTVADAIRRRWAPRPVLVLCGPGNNGGDGFICAKALADADWPVRISLLGEEDRLAGDAAWARAHWTGPIDRLSACAIDGAELIVDALFGAGLSRAIEGEAAAALQAAARSGVPVVAVDLPSGVQGDRATALGPVAAAVLTVTFHRPKPAHILEPAATLCGEVVVADIGIPDGWQAKVEPVARCNRPEDWMDILPDATASLHKHARGRLVVFSGGASSTGAARMAARAGLRVGAGLATLASPPGAVLVNAATSTAVMVRRLGDEAGAAQALLGETRAEAAVLGPGFGTGEGTCQAVLSALRSDAALVLDADALTSFEDDPGRLFSALRPGDLLTPHEGEFRRLFGEIDAVNRLERTRIAADRAGCVVVLKGPDTVIAAPGRPPVVNTHATPHLATAGTGDVLAGLIAGLIAQGMGGFDAACASVWLHGDAARGLGAGLIAEDLPERVPAALQALARHRRCRAALRRLPMHKSE